MSCYLRTPAIVFFSVTNTSAYPVRNLRVEYNQQLEHFFTLDAESGAILLEIESARYRTILKISKAHLRTSPDATY